MEAKAPWAKVDRAGRPTGKARPEPAAAGGIDGSRIDLGAGAG
jgi:hypothetical protein